MKFSYKVFCQNSAIFILSIVIAIVFAEIGIRLTEKIIKKPIESLKQIPPHPKGMYRIHEKLGYILTPNFKGRIKRSEFTMDVSINKDGVRSHYESKKQFLKHSIRVLVLGDSFAFGWGVQEKEDLSSVAEKILRKNLDIGIISGGVPGYSTKQEVDWLNIHGWEYKPNIVVLAFYVDLLGNILPEPNFVIENGYLVDLFGRKNRQKGENILKVLGVDLSKTDYGSKSIQSIKVKGYSTKDKKAPRFDINPWGGRWLSKHLKVYSIASKGYDSILKKLGLRKSIKKKIQKPLHPQDEIAFMPKGNRVGDKAYKQTMSLLDYWRESCKKHDSIPVLMIIPTWHQIFQHNGGDILIDRYDISRPEKELINWCEKQTSVMCIPLIKYIIDHPEKNKIFYNFDMHWTAEGHRIAGEIMAKRLIELIDTNKRYLLKD